MDLLLNDNFQVINMNQTKKNFFQNKLDIHKYHVLCESTAHKPWTNKSDHIQLDKRCPLCPVDCKDKYILRYIPNHCL